MVSALRLASINDAASQKRRFWLFSLSLSLSLTWTAYIVRVGQGGHLLWASHWSKLKRDSRPQLVRQTMYNSKLQSIIDVITVIQVGYTVYIYRLIQKYNDTKVQCCNNWYIYIYNQLYVVYIYIPSLIMLVSMFRHLRIDRQRRSSSLDHAHSFPKWKIFTVWRLNLRASSLPFRNSLAGSSIGVRLYYVPWHTWRSEHCCSPLSRASRQGIYLPLYAL